MTDKFTISVIGLGKLGKPIYEVFKKYYKVIGLDKGDSFAKLGDITFVVVPTPSLPNNYFSSENVEDVLSKITKKQTVVIVSTLMPGETDRLQEKYPHLSLVYNPTFVALGSVTHDFTHPDLLLIGGKPLETDLVASILLSICKALPKIKILTPLEAEIAKITLNCYITTKITFANQIGNLCYRLNISPDKILEAVGCDSRIGNKYFKAGLGYGGPCFPRDNLAMSAFMEKNNLLPFLMNTVHTLNEEQVEEIIKRVEKSGIYHIGFSGLSYKEGTDCEEESQIKKIFLILKARGYGVKIGKADLNITWEGIK